ADKIAVKRAFRDGHQYALQFARAAGLKLGGLISVTDDGSGSDGYYGGYGSPFGPNKYCGKVRVPVGKPVDGQKPTFKKVRRCFVPSFITHALTLTYAATSGHRH